MNATTVLPLAIDLAIKSSLLMAAVWVVLRVWKNASAAQRVSLWCTAFAVLAVLPFTRLVAPHWVLSLPGETAPSRPPLLLMASPGDSIVHASGGLVISSPVSSWINWDGMSAVAGIWFLGFSLLLAYRLIGALQLNRCRYKTARLQDEACERRAASIACDLGISRPVEIRVSEDFRVPVTWGTWKPVVTLPVDALTWPQEWLDSALRHELGHVKHCDHLRRLLTFFICAFYWPNPLVWAAAKRLQLAQEEASDNFVLGMGVSPQSYATQLVHLIQSAAGHTIRSIPAVAMARPSSLEGRLSAILDDKRNRGGADRRLMLAGTGLAVVLGLALGVIQLRAADSSQPTTEANSRLMPSAAKPDVALDAEMLTVRTFLIPPGVLKISPSAKVPTQSVGKLVGIDVERQLVNLGFSFPVGASAILISESGKIVVRNTPEQLDLIGNFIQQLSAPPTTTEQESKTPDLSPKQLSLTNEDGVAAGPNDQTGKDTELKLKSIIIPKVNLDKVDIAVALQILTQKSKEADPDKKGVQFVLGNITPQDLAGSPADQKWPIRRQFSVTLDDVPLADLLGYITQQTNLKWSVEKDSVYFRP